MNYDDGSKYEGDWREDKKEGNGIYQFIKRSKYKGQWKNDKRDGNGTFTWKDGDKYIGEYKNGEKVKGKGKFYNKNLLFFINM